MTIPLSLYIHIPWCIKKCPYCDFNSHSIRAPIPEQAYVQKLIEDLDQELPTIWGRHIHTIFCGGGTPSLFSPDTFAYLFGQLQSRLAYSPAIEITLEANPGTVDQVKFKAFREVGFNRLSLGIQSFQDPTLQLLGRIHGAKEARAAVEIAQLAGFTNFNLDLMFGLPQQTLADGLDDLQIALAYQPPHLSWYQLTLEPHTPFFACPPTLPEEDYIWEMQELGQTKLAETSYRQYEISAYSQEHFACQHNRNYWEFGDYLGIGAGAHSKITDRASGTITRKWKIKHPKHYLKATEFSAGEKKLSADSLVLEFLLNAFRLHEPIPFTLFQERTGLSSAFLQTKLHKAQEAGLVTMTEQYINTTPLGKRFLNDLLATIE